MKRQSSHSRIIRSFLIAGAAWLALSVPFSASAHGDEARVQLSATQAQPGTTIEVRGSGFEPDDQTTIMLVSADRPQLLRSATADADGNFVQVVFLPKDATDGVYEVHVADVHHVATVRLSVVTESCDDEESGQRGEDEPLLAPMPTQVSGTGYSGTAPTAITTATPLTPQVEPPIPIS